MEFVTVIQDFITTVICCRHFISKWHTNPIPHVSQKWWNSWTVLGILGIQMIFLWGCKSLLLWCWPRLFCFSWKKFLDKEIYLWHSFLCVWWWT